MENSSVLEIKCLNAILEYQRMVFERYPQERLNEMLDVIDELEEKKKWAYADEENGICYEDYY